MLPNKNARNPKKITWHNFKNMVGAYWRMLWTTKMERKMALVALETPTDKEQIEEILASDIDPITKVVLIRTELVRQRSPECLRGSCVDCGCPVPDKFYELDGCKFCYSPITIEDIAKL